MSHLALRDRLRTLDGQSYGAYKSLKGSYRFADFTLHIDHVQGDPFAAPSQVRVVVPPTVAQFPAEAYAKPSRRVALEDYLIRQFYQQTQRFSGNRGSGKSGLVRIVQPSQAVLARTAATIADDGRVEVRFRVGLPAFGRRVAGGQAAELLCEDIPEIVTRALRYQNLDAAQIEAHCTCKENWAFLQAQLRDHNLVAFVANGSMLPRRSGVDERPLMDGGIPFQSPPSLAVSLTLVDGTQVMGMGIPEGITLIVGGGYHGKSTLLKALETGIYAHVPGDGRERVVTNAQAMKVRAEDGRSVVGVNISPFINHLPQGKSTLAFSTADASGSTSQAASIIEAVEAGATVLLMDEDTSATNFMIRDRRMQALIAKAQEPITPFVDKVRQLYEEYGISTILVMGGSGDYFDVADTVIALDNYVPTEVTAQASAIAQAYRTDRLAEGGDRFGSLSPRRILPDSIDPRKDKRAVSLKVRDTDEIRIGTEEIDLSAVEQLVEPGQTQAIAAAIVYAQQRYLDGQRSLAEVLALVMADIAEGGLDSIQDQPNGDLVMFRALELAAALNRLRSLKVRQ